MEIEYKSPYRVDSIGLRLVAYMLDNLFILFSSFTGGTAVYFFLVTATKIEPSALSELSLIAGMLIAIALEGTNRFLLPILARGYTLGKAALRLRIMEVVSRDEVKILTKPGIVTLFVRYIVFVACSLISIVNLASGLAWMISKDHQAFHDSAAKTVVVRTSEDAPFRLNLISRVVIVMSLLSAIMSFLALAWPEIMESLG